MNRFSEGTIVIGKRIELTEDKVLKLEIEMIELGRLFKTDGLEYNSVGNLVVKYESMVKFMDQQLTQVPSQIVVVVVSQLQFILPLKLILHDSPVDLCIMNMVMKENI